jgi:hypothetical protein
MPCGLNPWQKSFLQHVSLMQGIEITRYTSENKNKVQLVPSSYVRICAKGHVALFCTEIERKQTHRTGNRGSNWT